MARLSKQTLDDIYNKKAQLVVASVVKAEEALAVKIKARKDLQSKVDEINALHKKINDIENSLEKLSKELNIAVRSQWDSNTLSYRLEVITTAKDSRRYRPDNGNQYNRYGETPRLKEAIDKLEDDFLGLKIAIETADDEKLSAIIDEFMKKGI